MDGVVPPRPDADEASEAVRHAQAELERAVREGGLTKDPLRLPLGALAVTLGAQLKLHRANVVALQAVTSSFEAPRPPIDQAAVNRIEMAAANGAARRVDLLSRAHFWRTAMLGAAAMASIAVAAGFGGYIAGRSKQVALTRDTEAGVSAAFRDSPASAAMWLNLMRSNDPAQALAECKGKAGTVIDGRRACSVPMWLDPPRTVVPGAR